VLWLVLILLLIGFVVAVLLWVGTLFVQSYIYSQPTEGLPWRAPIAGGAIALFLAVWCLIDYRASNPLRNEMPLDTVFSFSASETYPVKPIDKFWSVAKRGGQEERTLYTRRQTAQTMGRFEYRSQEKNRPWSRDAEGGGLVTAIILPDDNGQEVRYNLDLPGGKFKEGELARYVRDDNRGDALTEDDVKSGQRTRSRWDLLVLNVFFNLLHLGLWFAIFWPLLRFQWLHALGLAVAFWLVMTLAILPMVLAQVNAVRPRTAPHSVVPQPDQHFALVCATCGLAVRSLTHERCRGRPGLRATVGTSPAIPRVCAATAARRREMPQRLRVGFLVHAGLPFLTEPDQVGIGTAAPDSPFHLNELPEAGEVIDEMIARHLERGILIGGSDCNGEREVLPVTEQLRQLRAFDPSSLQLWAQDRQGDGLPRPAVGRKHFLEVFPDLAQVRAVHEGIGEGTINGILAIAVLDLHAHEFKLAQSQECSPGHHEDFGKVKPVIGGDLGQSREDRGEDAIEANVRDEHGSTPRSGIDPRWGGPFSPRWPSGLEPSGRLVLVGTEGVTPCARPARVLWAEKCFMREA
jgi:hypothetical protein